MANQMTLKTSDKVNDVYKNLETLEILLDTHANQNALEFLNGEDMARLLRTIRAPLDDISTKTTN